MDLTISRDTLLAALFDVVRIIPAKSALPVISNVLLATDSAGILLVGTDMQTEIVTHAHAEVVAAGAIALSAKKLLDIAKSATADTLRLHLTESGVQVTAGRGRFRLGTLPADDFPRFEIPAAAVAITLSEGDLHRVLNKTAFAMANLDVRFYLNGLHLRADGDRLTLTATDGHRLARAWTTLAAPVAEPREAILHRTPVIELARRLRDTDRPLVITLSEQHWGVQLPTATLASRLIDGKFPDADRVIPRQLDQTATLPTADLRRAVEACGILSNATFKGLRFEFSSDGLALSARNEQGEDAADAVEIVYTGPPIGIGFNLGYILDLLKAIDTERLTFDFSDGASSGVARGEGCGDETFVVMPMRL